MKIFQFNYMYIGYIAYVLITEIFRTIEKVIVEYLHLNVAQNCT